LAELGSAAGSAAAKPSAYAIRGSRISSQARLDVNTILTRARGDWPFHSGDRYPPARLQNNDVKWERPNPYLTGHRPMTYSPASRSLGKTVNNF